MLLVASSDARWKEQSNLSLSQFPQKPGRPSHRTLNECELGGDQPLSLLTFRILHWTQVFLGPVEMAAESPMGSSKLPAVTMKRPRQALGDWQVLYLAL